MLANVMVGELGLTSVMGQVIELDCFRKGQAFRFQTIDLTSPGGVPGAV